MSNMLPIKEVAKKWGITTVWLARLLKEGRIEGAEKRNNRWYIPADAVRPADLRVKTGAYVKTSKGTTRNTRLPLPIGISDYRVAASQYYYIDKTMMIRDFLDEVPMVSLFTRPRRFGKTLNMDMLRVFFEKSDEDTSVYFADKKIWECGDYYRSFQGKFPVIYLSFKDIKCKSWAETFDLIAHLISMEYKRHKELNDPARNSDLNFYQRIINGNASENDYMLSLMMLSKMLHDYHEIEPVIIIDEYDTPIQQGHTCGFYDDVVLFIRNLFSGAFKDNRHLKYGFLTGILRVAKESIFSGLNNLKINSVLDNHYSEYFGFTQEEVREMAAYYDAEEKYDEICTWYDGYRFGKTEIFNPWSVINYFSNDCIPGTYWLSTGSNDVIGEVIAHADEKTFDRMRRLMEGESILTFVDTSVIYPQIRKNPSSVYSFLLVAGYLKVVSNQINDTGDTMCEVALPNKEIRQVYNKEVLAQLDYIEAESIAITIKEALMANDVPQLKAALEQYLLESASFHDTSDETFYHGLVLGLCALFTGSYYVRSNRESGTGRYDIQLMPKSKRHPGFLLELKAVAQEDTETLKTSARTALHQIEEKRYVTEMVAHGVETIIRYGVAFSKKQVEIVSA